LRINLEDGRQAGRKKNEWSGINTRQSAFAFPPERGKKSKQRFSKRTFKKDYFVRSCIYNRVCVVGKKELVYQLVEELKINADKYPGSDRTV